MMPSPMRALCRGPKEKSPDELHLAVLTGRTKRIKHLLKKGVHIESVNSHGQTPLFCASFGGDNEVVELLLRLGANPNRRCGEKGATPVHGASYRGSRRVLRLLAEAGGDLSLTDNEQQTPRDYALKQPSPIRRQKILNFLDLLLAMTLHRSLARTATANTTLPHPTLPRAASRTSLALRRQGSLISVWGACVTEGGDSTPSPRSPPYKGSNSGTLHKTVSCHLLDQMYVSASLPLLTPNDLKRPEVTGIAYTCGGPTVYSPYTWLGTSVTVRRPTPALSLPKENTSKGEDKSALDQGACKSLVQELSVLRRLRHPAFLEVMAACHVASPQPDHITLVFQHVPHGSLYHHLHVQHHDLSVGGAVDILVGVVEALLFLHAHNWLHTALSSHALHLVSTNHAKLGGFEFAIEMHGKGCSMKAHGLSRAPWLKPWQAPETLSEQMVSTRSEIYSFTAIIWEIWSGMAPWAGVEEAEVVRRVGAGEALPAVSDSLPSLVTYLTQYGLKWNSHERELDLQEIHTMLRSLRIQSNEEDRVPAVPAWGPPSIPNTPVVGRHASHQTTPTKRETSVSNQTTTTTTTTSSSSSSECYNDRKYSSSSLSGPPQAANRTTRAEVPPGKASSGAAVYGKADGVGRRMVVHQAGPDKARGMVTSVDSGFSTPCTRTPSPSMDTITSAKINPSFMTSTPSRPPTTSVLRADLRPDLLPNKADLKSLTNGQTPDILSRGEEHVDFGGRRGRGEELATPVTPAVTPVATDSDHSRTSSPTGGGGGYGYISNAAKRAFLMETDGGGGGGQEEEEEEEAAPPERPSSASRLDRSEMQNRASSALRRTEVVRRGLSMTNISSPSFTTSTCVTRTTSHVSLASSSSSSSDVGGRRPVRTVSQITLTLRKLSQVSDSSSSKDDLVDAQQQEQEQQQQQETRSRRSRSVPKSPAQSARGSKKEGNGWEEITGIKPASHQLTRHSSSCSLASGPSSPTHHSAGSSSSSWLAGAATGGGARASSNQGSQPHSPVIPSRKQQQQQQQAVGRRWNSISGTTAGLGDTAVKIQTRRHSEGQRPRPRRSKRRQEVEVEEEFFDDEFNASLFQQPHMQLSVGSSENLLDSRAPHSMLADGSGSPVSLGFSSFSPSLTSSEDEEDEAGLKEGASRAAGGPCWRLGAVAENGNSEEDDDEGEEEEGGGRKAPNTTEDKPPQGGHASEAEDGTGGPWRYKELSKEYEPLKSVELLRSLGKSLSTYLPTYSIASDTESGEP